MGLRIRKTINLGNGVKLNISNSGTSITVGTRGNTTTFAKDGIYKNISTPGTGISYRARVIKKNEIPEIKIKNEETNTIILDNNIGGTMKRFKVYTDGGFCNTQSKGIGSWAYIILESKDGKDTKDAYTELKKDSGRQFDTTNNKMELQAVLEAMKALKEYNPNNEEDEIEIISDSMYVIKGSTEWVNKWKENEWKTLTGKDVKNQDLWIKILKIKDTYKKLIFNWIKGHDSDRYNIECDALCQAQIREAVEELQKD